MHHQTCLTPKPMLFAQCAHFPNISLSHAAFTKPATCNEHHEESPYVNSLSFSLAVAFFLKESPDGSEQNQQGCKSINVPVSVRDGLCEQLSTRPPPWEASVSPKKLLAIQIPEAAADPLNQKPWGGAFTVPVGNSEAGSRLRTPALYTFSYLTLTTSLEIKCYLLSPSSQENK